MKMYHNAMKLKDHFKRRNFVRKVKRVKRYNCMFVFIVKVKRGHLPEGKLFDL